MRAGLSATPDAQAAMSGSDPNDLAFRAPTTVIRPQAAIESGYGDGGHSPFFSSSWSRVASTYPTIAAPKHGNPDLIG